tara:strand:- start:205 stop:324 length:120 start_codon:yes stop_codon:yes gene_type:complete
MENFDFPLSIAFFVGVVAHPTTSNINMAETNVFISFIGL